MRGRDDATSADGRRLLAGWGRTAPSLAQVRRIDRVADAERLLRSPPRRGLIARGLGRAYGDAAQNSGGQVLDMRGLRAAAQPDEQGLISVGAGLSLGELIDHALPRGWFPSVVPGTRHVTIGGAIAADIHGKNHHRDGCFTRYVESLHLLTAAGNRFAVSPGGEPGVFAATAGGMGLTGVIVQATLRLMPVETSWMKAHTARLRDLDQALAEMASGDDDHRYSVAWIDCLARGAALGRSVLIRGDHAAENDLPSSRRAPAPSPLPRARLVAPPWAPSGLLRRSTVAAFNELYFHRSPRVASERLVPLHSFFFPLDAVEGWNRLYGWRGLLQYQFVVPFGAEAGLRRALELLSAHGAPAFLAVLKRFGPGGSPEAAWPNRATPGPGHTALGPDHPTLSFPMGGWTLALDLPATPDLGPVLGQLDELVARSGGRVYLAKDSRLRPELLEAMYPQLAQWQEVCARLDPGGVMRSDLGRRLGLHQDAAARATPNGRR
ncbi:MAG TPA: FAD-binding oxidoreductase [Solirubrobacteraceae bacterium]|nr:FAD-binding oxidoreductase [Solirubrobacteraceae bacterium]